MIAMSRFGFLAVAVIFHLVYLLSIFDIYFVSPIVSGMRLFGVERPDIDKNPATRLVLFVGDGLRADKAFQQFPEPYPLTDEDLKPRHLAPFLHSRALHHGTFGVSHTRVPTESRPGHVALIAGLYEDVSAVATGWKLNPVNFDSVFNRSRHTWSWGSPDILPMFERGAVPGRVDAYSYGSEFEDFSKDATQLDFWVFDHVKDFFAEASTNKSLDEALRQDKVVLFLHLLGIDTTGHSHRPYSKEYLHNIQVVDQGVKEVTELIQKFYDDNRTAFIFTADHGMSDWGSHGDGHPDNTRTPLICWGSGIANPKIFPNAIAPGHDGYSADWNLDHIQRHDVEQADVAALMSYLIGAEYPANSVGKLPLAFISADNREKAEALLINAREILEMYRVKEESKQANEIRYVPYGPLSEARHAPNERIAAIRNLIKRGEYEEAIEESDALIDVALEGLRYLQTYDWLFLRALITVGYLGWIAYAVSTVIDMFVVHEPKPAKRGLSTILFISVLASFYSSFIISNSPMTYYAYTFFPIIFWEEVFAHRDGLAEGRRILFGHIKSAGSMISFCLHLFIYVAIVVSLAFGYTHREVLTGLFILGSIWPIRYGLDFLRSNSLVSVAWSMSCLLMSTFTLLPAMKVENIPLISAGGLLMALIGISYLVFEEYILLRSSAAEQALVAQPKQALGRIVTGIQVGLVLLSVIVTRSSASSLHANQGLPSGNQVVGWAVVVMSFIMPFIHRLQPNNHYMARLMLIYLTCAPSFIILTISYEGLFYVAFSFMLLNWVQLEYSIQVFSATQREEQTAAKNTLDQLGAFRSLKLSDARVALFFLVLLQSAFFSTGNIASISSFSLESVSRLIPIFDPFSQGALLILKLMIPFALMSASLGVLNHRLGVAPSAVFMVVMAVTDILTLYFFWVVQDEGSWLEIGSSISHFAIASLLFVFVAFLEGVSAVFISGIFVEDIQRPQEESVKLSIDREEVLQTTNGNAGPPSQTRSA